MQCQVIKAQHQHTALTGGRNWESPSPEMRGAEERGSALRLMTLMGMAYVEGMWLNNFSKHSWQA